MFVKLVYGLQIHLYSGRLSLSALKSHAHKVFKRLPRQYILTYVDSEGDRITVTTEEDLIGIKCGVIKMNIVNVQEGLISGEESQQSDFDDFVGYSEVQFEPGVQVIEQIKPEIKGYVECKSKEEDSGEDEENLLVSMSKDFFADACHNSLEEAAQEQELSQQISKEFVSNLGQAALNKTIQHEQMLLELSRNFVNNIGETCFAQAAKEQEECILKGCVNDFFDRLFANVTEELIKDQSQTRKQKKVKKQKITIQPIPKFYKKNISKSVSHKEQTPKQLSPLKQLSVKSLRVKRTPIKHLNLQPAPVRQVDIDVLVQEKVKALIPGIIQKVTQIVEFKLSKKSCINCERSELEVQKLINRRLMKKYAPRRQSSLEMSSTRANPEWGL